MSSSTPTLANRLTPLLGRAAKAGPSLLRGALPLIALAVAGTALVLMLMWREQSHFKPLFGKSERVSSADMLAVLDAEHIAYRLHPESGQVLVAENDLGKARMVLAAKGVVAKLPAGLELMDKNDPLGVSQFVQDVRFRRGLEGELSQSIMALDPVETARVHLSIAKSSSFVMNDGQKSSASVVLGLKAGQKLSREQIAAVINMVAGSVASLEPSRVSLVDQAGDLLSARVDLTEGFDANGSGENAQARVQDEVRRNVRELLGNTLGENNYRVSVTAEIDNDSVQETREQYGDAPKLTNEAMREEQDRGRMALGIPGSLSNRPVAGPDAGASAPENDSATRKNAATRQYAYDRAITQTKKSRGRLARLSVAVALNDAAAPAGAKTWSPEAISRIEKLLASGLGIKSERGDSLVISTLAFPQPPVAEPWYQQRDNLIDIGSWIASAVGLLLGYLLVLRPLLRLATSRLAPKPVTEVAQLEPLGDDPHSPHGAALTGHAAHAAQLPGVRSALPVVPLLENYELPPSGSPVDVLVDHLKVLAGKEPERVAEVVKQWVQKKHA